MTSSIWQPIEIGIKFTKLIVIEMKFGQTIKK